MGRTGLGHWWGGRRLGRIGVRLGVASLVTMAAVGAFVLSATAPAEAIGLVWYAYPQGQAVSPTGCPQTTTPADQCTLTQALSLAGFGDDVQLAVSGVESDPSTYYVGNFDLVTSDLNLHPAPGVSNPIIDGNNGSAIGCPTTSCSGPVLSVNDIVTVSGVTIQHGDNRSGNGGGIDNNGELNLSSSAFLDNTATGDGGAIDNEPAGVLGFMTFDTFSGNTAGNGGAIANTGHTSGTNISVANGTFSDNTAGGVGGAIENGLGFGSVSVVASSFVGNTASDGGGAIINGYLNGGTDTLTVSDSTFLNDSSTGTDPLSVGGAIDNAAHDPQGVTATVTDSTFTSDSAFAGGAISNGTNTANASLTVTGSTFSGDTANRGGAIDSGDDLGSAVTNVSASTFSGNSATTNGGAIDVADTFGSGQLVVSQSTFADNNAGNAGGSIASFSGGTVSLSADILAESSTGDECGGLSPTFQDLGFNVYDDGSCPLSASSGTVSNSQAIDAYLGSLDNHGGPTNTIPLEASPTLPVGPDPALDVIPQSFLLPDGSAACSVPDQRGVARTAPCDIGAFEVHPTNVATETTLVGSATNTAPATSVTYTATVIPTTDDEPGSAVTFTQDGAPATCTGYSFDGQAATCTITYPTPGTHQVRATYGGDAVFAASAPSAPWTTTVAAVPLSPTTTALTSTATGVAPGQSLTLTATVTPAQAGPSPGSVTFEDDGQPLNCAAGSAAFDGTAATCVTSFPGPTLPQHEVTAAYSGDSNAAGSTSSPLLITVAFANPGYRVAAADGGVFAFGPPFDGSMGGQHLNAPIVGIATDNKTGGYWLVASDGGIFSFDAPFFGSMGGQPLNEPIVGMAATRDGSGYWLVASDGGIFAFGTAAFHGSMGGQHLNAPVVGMAPDGATGGYWLVASDGGIFSFDAPFEGSTGSLHLDVPVAGMASTASGAGYWLVASDGGVFTYGDAAFHGSNADTNLASPIVGITPDIYTGGYWLLAANGATRAYGAPDDGMFPDLGGPSRAVAIAAGGIPGGT